MSPNVGKFRCALVIAAAAGAAAGPAAAIEGDPLRLILAQTLSRDDNVFRVSSAAQPVTDTIISTNLRLALDKDFGSQHLRAALSQTDNRYGRLGYLNNKGSNHQLSWQGLFPDRWTADASWQRSASMASFADFRNISNKDVVTVESKSFRLGYLPHPDWPVYVQVDNSDSSNSLATLAFNDARTSSTEMGLQYNSPLGNQAVVLVRKTDGHYPNQVGNSYRQEDIQAVVQWKPGTMSGLSLRMGQTRREQENLPQRNFSGATGSLTFNWELSSMTSINANMGRDISPVTATTPQDFNLANYALSRSYGIGARWAPTPKVSAEARISYLARVIGGVPTDTTRASTLMLQYAPIPAVQTSLQLRHEVREADNPLLPFASNVATLNATLSF